MSTKDKLDAFCTKHNITSFEGWVRRSYADDDLDVISTEGCENGVTHLDYFTETTALYQRFSTDIWMTVDVMRQEIGYTSIIELLSARPVTMKHEFERFMVWFAVEHLAATIIKESCEEDDDEDQEYDYSDN